MEKIKNAIKTTFRCKHCKTRLVIVEDRRNNVLMFGCQKCDCYLIIPEWRMNEFKRKKFFDWQGFMKYAYNTYLDARDSVCQ